VHSTGDLYLYSKRQEIFMTMPTDSDEQYVHAYQYSKGSPTKFGYWPAIYVVTLYVLLSSSFVVPGFYFGPDHHFYLQYHFFQWVFCTSSKLEGKGKALGDSAQSRTNTDFPDLVWRFFVGMSQIILQATLSEYYFPDIVAALDG